MQLILDNVSGRVSINLETAEIEITYRKHANWKHVDLKKKNLIYQFYVILADFFKKSSALQNCNEKVKIIDYQ